MSNLYETISLLCDQRGIKPGRLCAELGLSRGLMTDLKMGRKKGLNAETAQKIAAYFDVTVGYLLGSENEKSPMELTMDDFTYAMYREGQVLTEENKQKLLEMAAFFRQQQEKWK